MSVATTFVKNLGASWANRRAAKSVQMALTYEARQIAVETDLDSDRLWQKIEADLKETLHVHREDVPVYRALWWQSLAAAVVAAFILSGIYLRSDAPQLWDGIKGTGENVDDAYLRSLRFALVKSDGSLEPGYDYMRVRVGTPIVFSVDSEGLENNEHLSVRLDVILPPNIRRSLVGEYALRQNREALAGGDGYFAYTPKRSGRYVFVLQPINYDGGVDEVSFTLEVE